MYLLYVMYVNIFDCTLCNTGWFGGGRGGVSMGSIVGVCGCVSVRAFVLVLMCLNLCL